MSTIQEIQTEIIEDSDLNITINKTDILFIDSWHCYGQLIRELDLHHKNVNKYIILHDTTVDEFKSEIIRMPSRWKKSNYQKIIKDSGFFFKTSSSALALEVPYTLSGDISEFSVEKG